MNIHIRINSTPLASKEIWPHYGTGNWTIMAIELEFRASRSTSYMVIDRAQSSNSRHESPPNNVSRPKRPQSF